MDRQGGDKRKQPNDSEAQRESLLSRPLEEQLLEIKSEYLALPEATREKLAGRFVAN